MLKFSLFAIFGLAMTICSALKEAAGLRAGKTFLNSSSTVCPYEATCTASGIEGVCVSISAGCCSGTVKSLRIVFVFAYFFCNIR